MSNLLALGCWDEQGRLRVVVESPKGATVKMKYDPRLETFVLQRFISRIGYPYDWGFVPSTTAPDGDPLDALVMHDTHTWPGAIIPSVCIGVLRVTETKSGAADIRRNDRLIAVAADRPAPSSVHE